jgi:hypothetical protein
MRTETRHASELAKVCGDIFVTRYPERLQAYREALTMYKRRLRGREEEERDTRTGIARTLYGPGMEKGFTVTVMGQEVWMPRPLPPSVFAYRYRRYQPGELGWKAQDTGLLANARWNRNMRPERVEEYSAKMEAGQWRDLLSDPITLTDDGEVINGQHRIAAAARLDWTKIDNDPLFLVIWGVDASEALFADGSRRTPKDMQTIAERQATA